MQRDSTLRDEQLKEISTQEEIDYTTLTINEVFKVITFQFVKFMENHSIETSLALRNSCQFVVNVENFPDEFKFLLKETYHMLGGASIFLYHQTEDNQYLIEGINALMKALEEGNVRSAFILLPPLRIAKQKNLDKEIQELSETYYINALTQLVTDPAKHDSIFESPKEDKINLLFHLYHFLEHLKTTENQKLIDETIKLASAIYSEIKTSTSCDLYIFYGAILEHFGSEEEKKLVPLIYMRAFYLGKYEALACIINYFKEKNDQEEIMRKLETIASVDKEKLVNDKNLIYYEDIILTIERSFTNNWHTCLETLFTMVDFLIEQPYNNGDDYNYAALSNAHDTLDYLKTKDQQFGEYRKSLEEKLSEKQTEKKEKEKSVREKEEKEEKAFAIEMDKFREIYTIVEILYLELENRDKIIDENNLRNLLNTSLACLQYQKVLEQQPELLQKIHHLLGYAHYHLHHILKDEEFIKIAKENLVKAINSGYKGSRYWLIKVLQEEAKIKEAYVKVNKLHEKQYLSAMINDGVDINILDLRIEAKTDLLNMLYSLLELFRHEKNSVMIQKTIKFIYELNNYNRENIIIYPPFDLKFGKIIGEFELKEESNKIAANFYFRAFLTGEYSGLQALIEFLKNKPDPICKSMLDKLETIAEKKEKLLHYNNIVLIEETITSLGRYYKNPSELMYTRLALADLLIFQHYKTGEFTYSAFEKAKEILSTVNSKSEDIVKYKLYLQNKCDEHLVLYKDKKNPEGMEKSEGKKGDKKTAGKKDQLASFRQPSAKPKPKPKAKPNAKVQQEAKAKAEKEAKARAEKEAKAKAEKEAKSRAEKEGSGKREQDQEKNQANQKKGKGKKQRKTRTDGCLLSNLLGSSKPTCAKNQVQEKLVVSQLTSQQVPVELPPSEAKESSEKKQGSRSKKTDKANVSNVSKEKQEREKETDSKIRSLKGDENELIRTENKVKEAVAVQENAQIIHEIDHTKPVAKIKLNDQIVDILKDLPNSSYLVGSQVRERLLYGEDPDLEAKVAKLDIDLVAPLPKEEQKSEITFGNIVFKRNDKIKIPNSRSTFYENTELHIQICFSEKLAESLDADSITRDFTINALYADAEGNVYDPTGRGIKDFYANEPRTVATPPDELKSLCDNPIRILRLLSLYVSGFKETYSPTDLETTYEYLDRKDLIHEDQIFYRLDRLLMGGKAKIGFDFLVRYKLFQKLFPGITEPNLLEWLAGEFNIDDLTIALGEPLSQNRIYLLILAARIMNDKISYEKIDDELLKKLMVEYRFPEKLTKKLSMYEFKASIPLVKYYVELYEKGDGFIMEKQKETQQQLLIRLQLARMEQQQYEIQQQQFAMQQQLMLFMSQHQVAYMGGVKYPNQPMYYDDCAPAGSVIRKRTPRKARRRRHTDYQNDLLAQNSVPHDTPYLDALRAKPTRPSTPYLDALRSEHTETVQRDIQGTIIESQQTRPQQPLPSMVAKQGQHPVHEPAAPPRGSDRQRRVATKQKGQSRRNRSDESVSSASSSGFFGKKHRSRPNCQQQQAQNRKDL